MIELANKRLVLVGTSHISKESVELVREVIEERLPTIVAVELDKNRLEGLRHPRMRGKPHLGMVRQFGVTGFLFFVFASWAQQKLGKVVKLSPGADMLSAVKTASAKKIPIALIDQDIQVTIRKLSQRITWKERWHFFRDLMRGIFSPEKEMKRLGLHSLDLSKVPPEELIDKMVRNFRTSYPTLYKVLIQERNIIMARKIELLLRKDPSLTVVAVIGAGHEKDIAKILMASFKEDPLPKPIPKKATPKKVSPKKASKKKAPSKKSK